MPLFKGSDFEIQLPSNAADESTYAFALPARANFRPSVVIKTERLRQSVPLRNYVDAQLEKLRSLLRDFVLTTLDPVEHDHLEAYQSVYEWRNETLRLRQKQRYLLLTEPLRVVTLTATSSADTFAEAESLFDAMFDSFRPLAE